MNAKGYLADVPGDWRHPEDNPPPKSTKILILTQYGVTITGEWNSNYAAWMPLPKITSNLKQRLRAEGRLK